MFSFAESQLGLAHGTIRATVLIETFPAAFEMDEILYERFVLPDRDQILMTLPFMRAYTELLVQTAHKRGAHAIGGMSAFIPNRRSPEVTERALERVAADKRREARDGFDGSWVAHPDLIPTARAEFDAVLADRPNQLERTRDEVHLAGVRANVSITVRYLESWLRGVGAAAIDNLMEDAATAEISRSQLWQWMHQDHRTVEGEAITRELVEGMLTSVLEGLPRPEGHKLVEAEEVFRTVTLQEDFPTFLTVPAYARFLVEREEPVVQSVAA